MSSYRVFLLPYVVHETPTKSCQLLLIGGDTLWEETDPRLRIEEDMLEPNGLWLKGAMFPRTTARGATTSPTSSGGDIDNAWNAAEIVFCPIDPVKTVLSDFYEYDEISIPSLEDSEGAPFCWRRFYPLLMENPPLRIRLGTTAETIPLGQLLRVLPVLPALSASMGT